MNKINLDIPADAKSVTLNLKHEAGRLTLRNMMPAIHNNVELVVEDKFGTLDVDRIRLFAGDGSDLVNKLTRSRVLDGETILDLVPFVKARDPQPRLINGSSCIEGSSVIELYVTWPQPDEED